jgi:hypothetical protein
MKMAQAGSIHRTTTAVAPRQNAVVNPVQSTRPPVAIFQRNAPKLKPIQQARGQVTPALSPGRPASAVQSNSSETRKPRNNGTKAGAPIQRIAMPNIVIQRVKYYPNLHPGAAVQVERDNIFRLNYFADQYRLHKLNNHGAYVPNLKYNFVRTQGGDMLLHNRYRHPSLAEGQQVLYAGEVSFNNGKLNWWSNGSGHYQPDEDYAKQAGLPMDQFFSYQQILKGEHERKNDSR